MEHKIKSQRLEIGDLFSAGWQLYNAHFPDILRIMLFVYIPLNLVTTLLPMEWQFSADGTPETQLAFNFALLFEIFIGIIATIAIAAIVEQAVDGETLTWPAALRFALSKWAATLGTVLLATFIITGLTFLLIIPGIIWGFYYAFVVYASALRNVSGPRALAYSKRLVQGQWWRICGILLTTGLIGQFVLLMVTFLLTLIADNPVAKFIINSVADVISAFFLVVTVLFFLNTDYRKQQEVDSAAGDGA